MTLSSAMGICFCLCGQVVKAMALHARGHRFDSDHGYWFLDGYKSQGSLGRSIMGIGFWMGINLKESRVARKVGGATQSRSH